MNGRLYERQVPEDGVRRAGGEHHRMPRKQALTSAFASFSAARDLLAYAAKVRVKVRGDSQLAGFKR